jgi:uncharacterized OB-fold protein
VTPETAPFWSGAAEGRLLLNRCADCGLTYYYPRSHCPDCLSDEVAWVEASGAGEIYSYTVTSVVERWPDEYLPLVSAYVELEEGPRVLTAVVNCDADEIAVGTPVEVTFVPTAADDVAIPVFQPTG